MIVECVLAVTATVDAERKALHLLSRICTTLMPARRSRSETSEGERGREIERGRKIMHRSAISYG